MATRRESRYDPDGLPTAEVIAGLGYEALVAAWAAVDARWAGPDPDLSKFHAKHALHGPIVARLDELALTDPRIVRRVADADARPRSSPVVPGDLGQAEAAMALAVRRRSMVPSAGSAQVRQMTHLAVLSHSASPSSRRPT